MTDISTSVEKEHLRFKITWLLVLIIFGTVLRIWRLGTESFWLDEVYTANIIQKPPSEIISGAASDVYPPLYYLLLHGISKILGVSEFALRLPSTIIGILSIVVIWRLGKLLFEPKTALLAALFLVISPLHIRYSQEARAYSLLLFAIMCSYLFLVRLSRNVTIIDIAGYFLSVTITIWSHSIGIVYIGLQVIWITLEGLVSHKPFVPWKPWGLSLLASGFTFLPWLTTIYRQYQLVSSGTFWVQNATLRDFVLYLRDSVGSTNGFILASPFLLVFIIVWAKKREIRMLIYYGFVIPLAIYLFSCFVAPIFTIRNVVSSIPAVSLFIAAIFMNIRYKPLSLALSVFLCAGCCITLHTYYSVPQKEQWREAASYLQTNAQKNATIMYHQSSGKLPMEWYLARNDLDETEYLDDQTWLVLYKLEQEELYALINGRDITIFRDITLVHPINSTSQ